MCIPLNLSLLGITRLTELIFYKICPRQVMEDLNGDSSLTCSDGSVQVMEMTLERSVREGWDSRRTDRAANLTSSSWPKSSTMEDKTGLNRFRSRPEVVRSPKTENSLKVLETFPNFPSMSCTSTLPESGCPRIPSARIRTVPDFSFRFSGSSDSDSSEERYGIQLVLMTSESDKASRAHFFQLDKVRLSKVRLG